MEVISATIQSNKQLIDELYLHVFPTVARYVQKRGGGLHDAQDVFQDALVAYYEKHRPYNDAEEERAYLFGIVRNLWVQKFNSRQQEHKVETLADVPEESPEPTAQHDRLLRFLERSGKQCMELLTAFYYDKLSMQRIAARFGFSGERSATVQKYKCLEKVRKTIHQKKMQYDDFLE